MLKHLKIIAILVLFIEIALFIIVGKLIGVMLTLLLVILSTTFGVVLFKRQQTNIREQMQLAMEIGQLPNLNFMQHSMNSIAAILLIIPGFFTDVIGLLCLIPALKPKLLAWFISVKIDKSTAKKNQVIEGECLKHGEKQ